MNSFTTMGWIHFSFVLLRVITFILYFHYPSYAPPSTDLRAGQTSWARCPFRFKHLPPVIGYLVNFSSWGAFLDLMEFGAGPRRIQNLF